MDTIPHRTIERVKAEAAEKRRKLAFAEAALPLLHAFRTWITDDGERPGCMGCYGEEAVMVGRIDAALALLGETR